MPPARALALVPLIGASGGTPSSFWIALIWSQHGGAPKYTMFVPVDVLLAQLKQGTGGKV